MHRKSIVSITLLTLLLLTHTSARSEGWIRFGLQDPRNRSSASADHYALAASSANAHQDLIIMPATSSNDTIKITSIGYIRERLGAEIGFIDFGWSHSRGNLLESNNTSNEFPYNSYVETSGYYLAASGKLPLGRRLSLRGRLGIYFWEQDRRLFASIPAATFPPQSKTRDHDPFAGLALDFGPFSIDYELYEIDGERIKALGLSVPLFRF